MASSISGPNGLPEPRITEYGDCAIYLSYPCTEYNAHVNDTLLSLSARLRKSGDWEDVISGYDSLVGSFNPLKMNLEEARNKLEAELSKKSNALKAKPEKIIEIPVYYGGKHGLDMKVIETASGLSEDAIIELHISQTYRVAMMGFIPGFTFLSQAPTLLHHPRRINPRLSVPSGSIGLAGWQTGIYGLSSPGGWQIIGRTPLKVFDASRDNPFLWEAGDSLRFVPQSGEFPDKALTEENTQ